MIFGPEEDMASPLREYSKEIKYVLYKQVLSTFNHSPLMSIHSTNICHSLTVWRNYVKTFNSFRLQEV